MPVIPPSGSQPTQPASPQDTVQDIRNYCDDLWHSSDYTTSQIGGVMLSLIQNLNDLPSVISTLQSYFNCPNPNVPWLDFYMCSDTGQQWGSETLLPQIVNQLNSIVGAIAFTAPPITVMDKIFLSMAISLPPYPPIPGTIQAFERAILDGMRDDLPSGVSSYGTTSNLLQFIDSMLTDPGFFSNYSSISYSDLQGLFNSLQQFDPIFSLPNFTSYYFQLGQKPSPSSLETALLQQMRNLWSTGNISMLQTWLINTVTDPNFSKNYPGITGSGIVAAAQDIGIPLPSSFAQIFDQLAALLPSDPSSADYKMISDISSKWMADLFANPAGWNAQTWFGTNFGTPGQPYPLGLADLYMLYPLANAATIQSLVDIFIPGTTTYTPTAWDTIYRTLYVAHADTPGIYADFLKECLSIGSSNAKQAIESWIDNFALGRFPQYPGMSPKAVINFLANFNIVTTLGSTTISYICDYISNYIQNTWFKQTGRTVEDKRFGNTLIAQIQAWASGEAPPGKLSDLRVFITSQHYTTKFPQSAAAITDLLTLFGFTP